MAFPEGIWILALTSLVVSALGWKKFLYFISLGYGFSIAAMGLALVVMYRAALAPHTLLLALLLVAGYNNTAYYPSNVDLQSSLTLTNSCSSEFTLKTMAYVSILVPFVLAYIIYAWRSINNRKMDTQELEEKGEHAY